MSRGMRKTSVRVFFVCPSLLLQLKVPFILLMNVCSILAVHDARDRILLEGEDAEGGEDWGDGEEEVFGLDLEEPDSDNEDSEENEGAELATLDDQNEDSGPRKRKKAKKPTQKRDSSSSDSDSDEFESWGRTKSAYYASNAALLSGKEGEEDEEEANEMEEREARRLQARMRDNMQDEDYGLDDAPDLWVVYFLMCLNKCLGCVAHIELRIMRRWKMMSLQLRRAAEPWVHLAFRWTRRLCYVSLRGRVQRLLHSHGSGTTSRETSCASKSGWTSEHTLAYSLGKISR